MLIEQIASAGVSVEALAAFGVGEEGQVRMILDDAQTSRAVLRRTGVAFDEREVLVTSLPHRAGSLAAMARRLADAGVNIEAIYLLRSSADSLEFAVAVDEVSTARSHLSTS